MLEEHGWAIPKRFKDTWTCLAPWNALAVGLADSDTCNQVNMGNTTFPANDREEDNVLNSGIDLQFCVMKESEKKEAVYEVLRFLYEDETIRIYLDHQDHHYPSEMSVDAMIQTFLLDTGEDAVDTFLKRFDTDRERYNRDLIWKVQQYQKETEGVQ